MSDQNFPQIPTELPQPTQNKPTRTMVAIIAILITIIFVSIAFASTRIANINKDKIAKTESSQNSLSNSSNTPSGVFSVASSNVSQQSNTSSTISLQSSLASIANSISNLTPKLEGKFETLKDLDIVQKFNLSPDNKVKYSKAGKFTSGKYKDYDRIIVDISGNNQIGLANYYRFVVVTKDYKSYILEGKDDYIYLNATKILSAEKDFGSNLSDSIPIDNNFLLYKKPQLNSLTQDEIDKLVLLKDLGSVKIYENQSKSQNSVNGEKDKETYKSDLYARDETNLLLPYTLTTQDTIKNYEKYTVESKAEQDKNDKIYAKRNELSKQEEVKIPECKDKGKDTNYTESDRNCFELTNQNLDKLVGKPSYDVKFIPRPNIVLAKGDFQNGIKVFENYQSYENFACGQPDTSIAISKMSNVTLEPLGETKQGVEVFIPKNKESNYSSDLIKGSYNLKFATYISDKEKGEQRYQEEFKKKLPSLEEYSQNNPILVVKDIFGRKVLLQESDNQFLGGCGKPVIYLYPTVTTDVNLKFDADMKLDVDIPKYSQNKGWNVQAKPNGDLKDLQRNLTDCKAFENPKIGQEYALESCDKNQYPYIYWAGDTSKKYPRIDTGFVVSRESLEQDLKAKLSYIGLNNKEIQDMLEYWLPQMLAKNKPFYRFTLIQTKELNQLFPMTITPKPDSSIRVFLDWEELDNPISVVQQDLIAETRNGYTMVEWGGLKR
jgi:hypothetical protein